MVWRVDVKPRQSPQNAVGSDLWRFLQDFPCFAQKLVRRLVNALQDGVMKLVMHPDGNLVDESFTKLLGIARVPLILHEEQMMRIFYNLSFAHIKPPFDERFKVRCFQQSPRRVIGLGLWQNLQYLS